MPPIVCFLVMVATPLGLLEQLLALVLGVPVVLAARRRPDTALLILAVFLPLQIYLVAKLYDLGLPIPVVRGIGWLKEALVAGIVIAAVHAVRTSKRRTDALDRVALLWIAGVLLYALLPQVLSAPGSPTSIGIRIQGIRANAFFVLLFLGARHAPLPAGFAEKLRRWLLMIATLVAGCGLYQFLDPVGWTDFTFETIDVSSHAIEVLDYPVERVHFIRGWFEEDPTRVASVLLSPFVYADFLLIGLALASDRLLRRRPPKILSLVAVALGLGIVVSRTRINFIGAVAILALVLAPARGRIFEARVRVGAVCVVGLILLAPFLAGTRFTGAQGGAESSRDHVEEFTTGVEHLLEEPQGKGIGTAPGVGNRFELEETFISDNAILQVGNELGVVMMGIFVALLVVLLKALFSSTTPGSDGLAAALGAAGMGLVLAGMLHHVWVSIPVAWLYFAASGVALSRDRGARDEPHGNPALPQ